MDTQITSAKAAPIDVPENLRTFLSVSDNKGGARTFKKVPFSQWLLGRFPTADRTKDEKGREIVDLKKLGKEQKQVARSEYNEADLEIRKRFGIGVSAALQNGWTVKSVKLTKAGNMAPVIEPPKAATALVSAKAEREARLAAEKQNVALQQQIATLMVQVENLTKQSWELTKAA